jgi:uncharacterized protein with GYD domain
MPKYISFFTYTGEAWRRMVERPGNRAAAARRLIEEIGGSMETFYWMLGSWDGFVVYEVPDAATAAAFSGRVTSSGLLREIKTEQLISMGEARSALRIAETAEEAYVPPGAQKEWRAEYDVLGG